MRRNYLIQKRTTKGWATIAVARWLISAILFERKYHKKHKGCALRRVLTEVKKV